MSVKNGEQWLDSDGIPIQAHGGGILFNEKDQRYYWYGEDKTEDNLKGTSERSVPMTGIHAYSSKDLLNWDNEGVVLPVFNNPRFGQDEVPEGDLPLYLDESSEEYQNFGVEYDPVRSKTGIMRSPAETLRKHHSQEQIVELNALYADKTNIEKAKMYQSFNWDKIVERPKVIYNKQTDKYVMWWHHDGPISGQYTVAEGGVAISDSASGPFKYLGTSRMPNTGSPNGNEGMLRDMTLFVDENLDGGLQEKAYLIYASEENKTTIILELNETYTGPATNEDGESIEGVHWVKIHEYYREAPTLFKQDDVYYSITSGQSGWDPNPAEYHISTNGIFGPWIGKGDPMVDDSKGTTFDSQSTYVLPYRNKLGEVIPNKFIFMADRWTPENLKDSRYIWLPFEVDSENQIIQIKWLNEWDLSVFEDSK